MYSRLFLVSVNVELLSASGGTAVISSSACLAPRGSALTGSRELRSGTIDRRTKERGGVSLSLSLFLCLPSLFFSRACDYARLRRTVGDRDEGWVVCRDGIAGAPLIYPFTHPC